MVNKDLYRHNKKNLVLTDGHTWTCNNFKCTTKDKSKTIQLNVPLNFLQKIYKTIQRVAKKMISISV